MKEHKTPDDVLISALRILAVDIQSDDGVANACIFEAASRLADLTQNKPTDAEVEPTRQKDAE